MTTRNKGEPGAFIDMLERAGVGHGRRQDYNPDGESVQVEHPHAGDHGFTVSDWQFDAEGKLLRVEPYEGEEG